MSKPTKATLDVNGTAITVFSQNEDDYISLTDIARYKDPVRMDYLISNWLRNRNTIEFLGIWERLYNPDFNPIEFDGIRKQAGLNSFILTAKQWIDNTGAIGLTSKAGRYGGTFAHKDIAFEFASWISVELKLYLIKEFQRLKADENRRLSLAWNLNRTLSKLNYRIHTDAIKAHLIPATATPSQAAITYANEADLRNVALFGQTAQQWRVANPASSISFRKIKNQKSKISPDLPVRLVGGDGYRVRQINATRMLAGHRDFNELLGVVRVEVLGKSATLGTESKGVTRFKAACIEVFRALCAQKKNTPRFDFIEESLPVVVQAQIQMLPVVEPCALDVVFREMKTQGSDQMQRTSKAHTDSSDRPRVMRDLRMDQHDVERIGCQAWNGYLRNSLETSPEP